MSHKKNVPAKVVRTWLIENAPEANVGARGRLRPEQVAVFHKNNKGLRYVPESDAEKRTITVPVRKVDRLGRASTRQVTVTTEEARKILGQEGRKGRFNRALLSEALSNLQDA